ncbi:hypothetical protein GCM10010121_099680 [Streptomyces brasiliensis]|uniref:Zinc-finger domain-containing protein n=1 Tax=Streptomyces brasiliensis TaxID=1954 RepID=A0A917PF43_9ACTN|nr:hypothetical protein GCM10010121_099680 [Streptomyces brasiliensis]
MATFIGECLAFRDLLAGHALHILAPEETNALVPHLAACSTCQDEHHCLAAVAAHLSSLHEALTTGPSPTQRPHLPGSTKSQAAPRQRRGSGPARGARTTSLTLSEWVDRMACVG